MLKKQINFKILLAVAMVFALFAFTIGSFPGCIPVGDNGLKRVTEMTPTEKGVWFLSMYNSQDKDYRNMVIRSDLTNDQKNVLRTKKKIMIQVYPMIKTYNTYIDSGAIPTKAVEDQIIELVNDLAALVVPKLE